MNTPAFALLAVLALSTVGVIADAFLKRASETERFFTDTWFLLAASIYALSAFGWVFALRNLKLATAGASYSVFTIVLLAVVGSVVFGERLSAGEIIALLLAIASLVTLARFA